MDSQTTADSGGWLLRHRRALCIAAGPVLGVLCALAMPTDPAHPTMGQAAIVAVLMTFLTELTSNTATTQIVLTILASLANTLGVSPLQLMVPATISASCAFMMPVATPPNAIVFSTGRLQGSDMARVGVMLNLVGAGLTTGWTLLAVRWML